MTAEQLFGTGSTAIKQYVDMLTSRGIDWGVIGPREGSRIWERHVLNSVSIADLIGDGETVADIGSGAGLPGIPLAILRPDLRITLVEPLLRRWRFLELAVEELGISARVDVVRARAEDLTGADQPRYTTVTSRALAPLAKVVLWCRPLMAPGGQIVAIKGRSAEDEVARDRGDLARMGVAATVVPCSSAGSAELTYAVVVRRR